MRDARRHEHAAAGSRAKLVVARAQLKLAVENVERLFELPVDVKPRVEPGERIELDATRADGLVAAHLERDLGSAQPYRLTCAGLHQHRLAGHGLSRLRAVTC